jgi:hypothetical protein
MTFLGMTAYTIKDRQWVDGVDPCHFPPLVTHACAQEDEGEDTHGHAPSTVISKPTQIWARNGAKWTQESGFGAHLGSYSPPNHRWILHSTIRFFS